MIGRSLLIAAVLAPALAGCVIYDSDAGESVVVRVGEKPAVPVPLETLSAARFENGNLIVYAASNGCTKASDFAVAVTDGDPAELSLTRETPDTCRPLVAVAPVELRWTYQELGLTPGTAARVLNPVVL